MSETRAKAIKYGDGWTIWEEPGPVRLVEMTCCGFAYSADHEDADGGYSCPLCEPVAPPGSVCVVLTPDEAKLAFYALALGEPTPEEKVIVDSARAKLDVAHYRALSATQEENDG